MNNANPEEKCDSRVAWPFSVVAQSRERLNVGCHSAWNKDPAFGVIAGPAIMSTSCNATPVALSARIDRRPGGRVRAKPAFATAASTCS